MVLRRAGALFTAAVLLAATLVSPARAADGQLWFDAAAVHVAGGRFTDAHGREVVLRGFNVSGEVKLAENGGLPFADVADARRSATAMRGLTGANTVRFLLSWAYAQPTPGQLDLGYLSRVTEQVRPFLDQGFRVFFDYHQDLYSRYLFNTGSWYTGDGAPQWVVAAGGYPKESCGICVQWGQNITQNAAVQNATYDFWHNRVLATPAGPIAVQDAFLAQAQGSMEYLRQHLTAAQFAGVVGFDPLNEPFAGRYDAGQDSLSWERDLLWPFYQRFRQRMDAAGWQDKPAFVEPNMFWDSNLSFVRQAGGLANVGPLGPRFVFNTHYYDHEQMSGIFMPGKARDGRHSAEFATFRERAAELGTAAVVSEFGAPLSGTGADKTPGVLKSMYQALDSQLPGAQWWSGAARSGPVLSATQWQWDTNHGRHRELMNDNPRKLLTAADAWNGEDFSQVRLDDAGNPQLRSDQRLLDRLYPLAVAGTTVAFTFEDRSRDGRTTMTWDRIPADLPNVARLVGTGQYGVLLWRSGATDAPTELHLPASFPSAGTTVVSDLGIGTGLPAYVARGRGAEHAIAVASQGGDARRLILSAPARPGAVHYALVTNGAPAAPADVLAAARQELARWAATTTAG
ncbi:MAG TPA: cellulase family glycosylhydrolase [Catenuloplanes sp.]|jgi:hypothetical protein